MSRRDVKHLQNVRHAIVHRHPVPNRDRFGPSDVADHDSGELLHKIAALMRLIRPMRQFALYMRGTLQEDGTIDIKHFHNPIELLDVPEVQKLFSLRTRDALLIRNCAPDYLRAMDGEYWKFRMAVQFHDAGHFQYAYWKARYSLWTAALESIYTTRHREHSGSKVAKERIRWLVGAQTKLYPLGEIPGNLGQCDLTVGDVLDDLYNIRNYIAHGDKIPASYFERKMRSGIGEQLNVPAVCTEALSFIIRTSLLRILTEGLLENFASAGTSQEFFEKNSLTNTAIRSREKQAHVTPTIGLPSDTVRAKR